MKLDLDLESLEGRLKTFQSLELDRSKWCEEILESLKQLKKEHEQVQYDLQSEQGARRDWQGRANLAEEELQGLRRINNQSSFAVVLIDGDGAIFQDALLKRLDGGQLAAHQLLEQLNNHLQAQSSDGAPLSAVLVFLYLNVAGLARALRDAELITHTEQFYDFLRDLCMGKFINVVDVGRGKERADYKIKDMFEFYHKDIHCRQIIFGGCHDNGYIPLLGRYAGDDESRARITLLETTPMEKGYRYMAFESMKLEIFRNTELPSPPRHRSVPTYSELSDGDYTEAGSAHSTIATARTTDLKDGADGASELQRKMSNHLAYAAVTSKPTELVDTPPPTKVSSHGRSMVLDAKKDRVDVPLQEPSRAAIARVETMSKTKKLCNDHYLVGHCYRGDDCPFDHESKLSPDMLLVLRRKARTLSCSNGKDCTSFTCVYGHNCSFTVDRHPRAECFFKNRCALKINITPRYRLFEDGHMVQL